MYLDLLCDDNYINVNIKLAKLTNLSVAVYAAELLNIIRCVIRKKKYDELGFFTIDRKYVEERTTLSLEDQLNCDILLGELGIMGISEDNKNSVRVDLEKLTSILIDDDAKKLASVSKKLKVDKTTAAANKKAGIIESFQNSLVEPDPNILEALKEWIANIYEGKNGFLTKQIIATFRTTISQYTSDKAIQLEIIRIAATQGWREASWAINSFERSRRMTSAASLTTPQKVATAVDTQNSF